MLRFKLVDLYIVNYFVSQLFFLISYNFTGKWNFTFTFYYLWNPCRSYNFINMCFEIIVIGIQLLVALLIGASFFLLGLCSFFCEIHVEAIILLRCSSRSASIATMAFLFSTKIPTYWFSQYTGPPKSS